MFPKTSRFQPIKPTLIPDADAPLGDLLQCLSPEQAAKWCVELGVQLPEQLVHLDPIKPFEFALEDNEHEGESDDQPPSDESIIDESKYSRFTLDMGDPDFELPPQYDDRTVFATDRWIHQNKPGHTWPELIIELERVAMANKWGEVPKSEPQLRTRLKSYCSSIGVEYVQGQRGNPKIMAKSKKKRGETSNPRSKPQG
ncbi:hypothetical protein [Rhodopirellula bahusiensis]|uniref:hypothetical protein n=1 Tax=Rhodopirellula bahusiensis TaxID=2014065 RepID=UPI00326667FE